MFGVDNMESSNSVESDSLETRPFVDFLKELASKVACEATAQDVGTVDTQIIHVHSNCIAVELKLKPTEVDDDAETPSPWRLFAAGRYRKMGYNGGDSLSLVKLQKEGDKEYIFVSPNPLAILALISF